MPFGLETHTIDIIQQVLSKYPDIEQAVLYGSRAKGNYKNGSDIDITLHGYNLTLSLLLQIENQLDDLLLPYKIDLSYYGQIRNPDLIEHIKRVGVIFYDKSKTKKPV